MANMNTPQAKEASSSPPMSSLTPLQLSGFLAGDTIRVQGDTGELRFSVQLNVNKKLFPDNPAPLDSIPRAPKELSVEEYSSFASSYVTPIASQPALINEDDSCRSAEEGDSLENSLRERVVTRLRSGAISPVNYFPRINLLAAQVTGAPCGGRVESRRRKKKKKKKRGGREIDAFERLLRRRSCPVRPCSSYAFFVMATWGDVNAKSSSFGETSKRLGQMWFKLPCKQKKVCSLSLALIL